MTEQRGSAKKKSAQQIQRRLNTLIEELVRETQPGRESSVSVAPRTRLDRDLGLDSLARAELLVRIEQVFSVSLPESALLAETPAELMRFVSSAHGVPADHAAHEPMPELADVADTPAAAETLNGVLDWHLDRHPDRPHLYIHESPGNVTRLSYGELEAEAVKVASGLVARGLRPGDRVALMLPTGRDYFVSFIAILRAGAVPVPIYPPARPAQLEEHLRRHGRILTNAGAWILVTVPEARRVAGLLRAEAPGLTTVVTAGELARSGVEGGFEHPAANSLGLLQYTSGSTGDPKGVTLTHAQLLANIRAMGERLDANSQDVFVSWLPLYHDMGLIAAWLGSMYFSVPLVVTSPLSFLARPVTWLELIHQYRATLSGSPNFGYELCLRALTDEQIAGLDLSSWRVAFNGAEPVSAVTMRRFAERLAPAKFDGQALMPVYGLAEAAVGLCVAPPGRGVVLDRIGHDAFSGKGEARPMDGEGEDALTLVSCGPPLNGYDIRIVDPRGEILPDRRDGEVEFRGPSATDGYFSNKEKTRELYHEGWLRTGDRGYLADGDLYISGRVKDVIVRGGRNIYPYDLEDAVGRVDGVRKGCVAVFGNPNPDTGAEELVVVAETRSRDAGDRDRMLRAIRDVTVDVINIPADDIRLVPPHAVLKTSSGKIRRAAVRESYRSGRLEQGQAAVWRQVVRLGFASAVSRMRVGARGLLGSAYSLYAWSLFGLVALLGAPVLLLLPRAEWRWRFAHRVGRLAARLAAIRLQVEGAERLPHDTPCVLVANHASYLDPLLLTAALPHGFRYIAKAELRSNAVLRRLLERMGVFFVERFDPLQASRDAEPAFKAVDAGESLAFFPEGTFRPSAGLGVFHMGAFVTAVRTGVPVVPVALRGSRELMRGSTWRPRPGPVSVVVGEPLNPGSDQWSEAVRLRDAARGFILEHCGEHDLVHAAPREDVAEDGASQ